MLLLSLIHLEKIYCFKNSLTMKQWVSISAGAWSNQFDDKKYFRLVKRIEIANYLFFIESANIR